MMGVGGGPGYGSGLLGAHPGAHYQQQHMGGMGGAPAMPFGMGMGIAELAMGMAAAGVLPQNLHDIKPQGGGRRSGGGGSRKAGGGAAGGRAGGKAGGKAGSGGGGVTRRMGDLRVDDNGGGGEGYDDNDDTGSQLCGGSVISQPYSAYDGMGGGGSVNTGMLTQDLDSASYQGDSASVTGRAYDLDSASQGRGR